MPEGISLQQNMSNSAQPVRHFALNLDHREKILGVELVTFPNLFCRDQNFTR